MTIRQFLAVLRAQWLIILLSAVVVMGAALYVTYQQTPVYQTQTRLFLSTDVDPEPDPPVDPKTPRAVGGYLLQRSDLATYVEIINAPAVLDPLRQELGLAENTPVTVWASVNEKTNVITITAQAAHAQLAADIANKAGPVLAKAAKSFSPLLASAGQRVTATTVSPAAIPTAPVSPSPRRNLALAMILGLGAGVGLALVRQVSDTRIRSDESIAAVSGQPILGHIPAVRMAGDAPMVTSAPHSTYAESIRRLRTNVLFVDVTTQSHSLVVSSASPGEGKTTTVINLAMALAASESRVLLVDGDLRNPSVGSRLNINAVAGLTTVLLGHAKLSDAIQQVPGSSLSVLTAGESPPNPSELLSSAAMETLYEGLMADYDFVIFDSPPLNPVIDAILLNKLTHCLVMVVAWGRTRKKEVENAITSLETVGANPAGFAVNFVSTAGMGSRYGYYGYESPYSSGPLGSGSPAAPRSKSRRGSKHQAASSSGAGST